MNLPEVGSMIEVVGVVTCLVWVVCMTGVASLAVTLYKIGIQKKTQSNILFKHIPYETYYYSSDKTIEYIFKCLTR